MTTYSTHELPKMQQPLLKLLGQEAAQLGYTAYVVGGFVRDSVLNHSQANFLDIDIVLDSGIVPNSGERNNRADLPGIDFANHLKKKYGGQIITHPAFGTAKWTTDDPSAPLRIDILHQHASDLPSDPLSNGALPAEIDLVTARDERYPEPAALPIVTPSDLAHDLRRRDITINMLAVCLAPTNWQQLCDQHNSMQDLDAGLVRVLHDQSFVDDPTRIFRAIRYECRYDFSIEPHTLGLLQRALPQIAKLTPVRIRHELDRVLSEGAAPESTLRRMEQLDVLAAIHPQLHLAPQIEQSFAILRATLTQPSADSHEILSAAPIKDLYWAQLLATQPPAISSSIAQRIELPTETVRIAQDLHALQQDEMWANAKPTMAAPNCGDLSPSQVVAVISQFDPLAIALFAADHQTPPQHRLYAARYLADWRHIAPILDGNDLRAMGIPPGPQYRVLLTALRNQRLDGHITDRASEVAYIKKNWA